MPTPKPFPTAAGLIARAAAHKIPMADICRDAGVAQSTPSRWKAEGWEPRSRTLRRMNQSLDKLIREQAAAIQAAG